MGSSIVGKPTCARTDPSTNSTNACTTDWGWTTTSTASYGRPNRKCASITSSALFTRLAESTVIFFPIFQVGWRNASSTVAPATRSEFQVRNGPPDAVRMSRASSPGRRPVMHCSTALCSESTGTISPPPSRAVRVTSSPAITSGSLLASATRFPAASAASVASSPAAPTIPFRTIWTSGRVAASTRHDVPLPAPRSPLPPLTSPTYAGLVNGGSGERGAGSGTSCLVEAATRPDVQIVLNGIVGAAGLEATLAALAAGKRVALANKETLVMAGELVTRTAREGGGEIVPVDSEHSAVLQCITGRRPGELARLI